MKIIKRTYCTSHSIRIEKEGKEIDLQDLTEQEQKEILDKILLKNDIFENIWRLLDTLEPEEEKSSYCEQCGDTAYKSIFEI